MPYVFLTTTTIPESPAFQFLFGFPVSGMEVPRVVVQTDVRDSIQRHSRSQRMLK